MITDNTTVDLPKEKCPNCYNVLVVELKNYDPVWKDGDVCCMSCGFKIRDYDAG